MAEWDISGLHKYTAGSWKVVIALNCRFTTEFDETNNGLLCFPFVLHIFFVLLE
jgi:hypothetical protein